MLRSKDLISLQSINLSQSTDITNEHFAVHSFNISKIECYNQP